jgi:hypothetical protein
MDTSARDQCAFLSVIETVVLFVRLRSCGQHRLSDEHLFDLMDAIHNVPEMLISSSGYFTAKSICNGRFADYDAKWGVEGVGLVRLLDEAYKQLDAAK